MLSLDQATAPPKKRLIVCCDGTCQTGDKIYGTKPSNVVKLSRMINPRSSVDGNTIAQVVYYQSGVATGGLESQISQGSFGWGLADNVASAYHYLSTNFEVEDHANSNDEILLFGFSRGAYTARALGGLITELGLLKPQFLNEFQRAFDVYDRLCRKAAPSNPSELPEGKPLEFYANQLDLNDREFWNDLKCNCRPKGKTYQGVEIKVIGVWDTVGALGLPESPATKVFPWVNRFHPFHSTSLNGKIHNAFQALALDEHRGAFTPNLWHLPEDVSVNLKQCWFSGFHESIGGGGVAIQYLFRQIFPWFFATFFPDTSEMHEITLAWMCDQIDGLVDFDRKAVEHVLLQHGKNRPSWAACEERDMASSLPFFYLLAFGGSHVRTPGRYYPRLPGYTTNESIHPSVNYRTRLKNLHYEPAPLYERSFSFYQFARPLWRVDVPRGFLSAIGGKLNRRLMAYLHDPNHRAPIWSLIIATFNLIEMQVGLLDLIWQSSCQLLRSLGLPIGCWEHRVWKKPTSGEVKPKQPFLAQSFLLLPVALPVFILKQTAHCFQLLMAVANSYTGQSAGLVVFPIFLLSLPLGLVTLTVLVPLATLSLPFAPLILCSALAIGFVAIIVYFSTTLLISAALKNSPKKLDGNESQRGWWVREQVEPALTEASQDTMAIPERVICDTGTSRNSKDPNDRNRWNFEARMIPEELKESLNVNFSESGGLPGDYWTRRTKPYWPHYKSQQRPSHWHTMEGV